MAEKSGTQLTPLIVGVNHRTGSLSLRDKLFVDDARAPAFLSALGDKGIAQAMVLSTCDRVEVIAMTNDAADSETLRAEIAAHGGIDAQDHAASFVEIEGHAAVRHLFRVAASLDSVVVGEPQVLGQVKAAHRVARDAGLVAGELENLMQAAYSAAKRVRTETAIGERPVSIAAVAVGVSRDVHGRMEDARGLIIGGGDMGEIIGGELLRAGLKALSVADAGERSSADMAKRLGARHVLVDDLAEALAEADIIVAAVGSRGHVLNADMVRTALKSRRYRPQFIVDAGLPSDVEPAVDRLDDAFLYDLNDLERLALEGLASRASQSEEAERLIDNEVAGYLNDRKERAATPALKALRDHMSQLREEVLREANGDAERATHMMMQRFLHVPSERMKAKATRGEDMDQLEQLIRDLFDITDEGETKT